MSDTITQPAADNCAADADRHPSAASLRGVDGLNFFLADVQTGVGPFLAIYLASEHWNPQSVGIALTVGSLAGIAAQTPAGALIDRTHRKRTLIAVGVFALAAAALLIASWPAVAPVMAAQAIIGAMSSVFVPGVAAISLGLVGHRAFDHQQGRNQTWNAAGNVVAAIAMGAIGYYITDRGIFFFVAIMIVPTLFFLRMVNPDEIDHDLAAGCKPGEHVDRDNDPGRRPDVEDGGTSSSQKSAGAKVASKSARFRDLLKDRRLVVFLVCCVLFHFANAAMLPLLGEMLAKGKGSASMAFMSACVVTTQLTVTVIAAMVGRLASTRGRKPLLLIGFGCLPIRGVLYTFTHSVPLLIGIQLLDGVAAGIFGVVSVLVIADLMRGTGRFNLAQGAIATAVGIGAALSQAIAGAIVHHSNTATGFLFLAAVAAVGWVLLLVAMPETSDNAKR